MDKNDILLLLNRGEPECYPEDFGILKDPNFFKRGFIFCWFTASGKPAMLFSNDPDDARFLAALSESGLLLISDGEGPDHDDVDRKRTATQLREALPEGATLYVCCHAPEKSSEQWAAALKKELSGHKVSWVNFRNLHRDRSWNRINDFFTGLISFEQLIASLFGGQPDPQRSREVTILQQVAVEARADGEPSMLDRILKTMKSVSETEVNEIRQLLEEIESREHSGSVWHRLFDYLDELSPNNAPD